MDLSEEVATEAAWAAASSAAGPHSLIRHSEMRLFWLRCFDAAEQVSLAAFWGSFPRDLGRCVTWQRACTVSHSALLIACTSSLITPGAVLLWCRIDMRMRAVHVQAGWLLWS